MAAVMPAMAAMLNPPPLPMDPISFPSWLNFSKYFSVSDPNFDKSLVSLARPSLASLPSNPTLIFMLPIV